MSVIYNPSNGGFQVQLGTALPIAALSAASGSYIPPDVVVARTASWAGSTPGIGAATYVYDSSVNSGYVAANPRTSFLASDGRGFRLWELFTTPEMFGAIGDGVTNDSAPIQAGIDYWYGRSGGTLYFGAKNYACNVVLKAGVSLKGNEENYGYLGTNPIPITRLIAFANGPIIDTDATGVTSGVGQAVVYMNLQGLGASDTSGAGMGIRIQGNSRWGNYGFLGLSNFADNGIYNANDNSSVNNFHDILAINCLLNRTRTKLDGVLHVLGNDHTIDRVEMGAGQSALSPAFQLPSAASPSTTPIATVGVVAIGSNMQLTRITGENVDVGMYTELVRSDIRGCLPNRTWAHGWVDKSSGGTQMVGNRSFQLGQAATNTYDGFYRLPGGGAINFDDFMCTAGGIAQLPRYAVNDQGGDTTDENGRPRYSNIMGLGLGTRTFNFFAQFSGPHLSVRKTNIETFVVGDTTPSVDNGDFYKTANTAATSITMFDDGNGGQQITVWVNDANTTIVNGSTTIRTTGGTNITTQGFYKFRMFNNAWYQQ